MENEKPKEINFWLVVVIFILIGVIAFMLIYDKVSTNVIYSLMGIFAIYLGYVLINKFIINIEIEKYVKKIIAWEKENTGLLLDIGTINGSPNWQVKKIFDELIIYFKKEQLVYMIDTKTNRIYARFIDTLYNAEKWILENKVLADTYAKLHKDRIIQEVEEKLVPV